MTKKIAKIEIIKAGSNPDVDSDFHTKYRDKVLDHCYETYGRENVSSIVTMSKLAAASAFKTMCNIYEIPYAMSDKIAKLIPPVEEGVTCTMKDIFNPASRFYDAAADFRSATAGDEWKKIIEGARMIEGRAKTTGVHACGQIISSQPLDKTIPMQVRKSDGLLITQWIYQECEALGLIKFDFLSLDNIDIEHNTLKYIIQGGKTPPNMVQIGRGPKDDKKTYEMLSRGDTLGVFQLGSAMVQKYIQKLRPTVFDDIVATIALERPGPMNMQSDVAYANRKNGLEKVTVLHSDFEGSELETILEPTYQLIVYQEQIMRIAQLVAGMSPQEAENLRKAMGKKKKDVMEKMESKFMSGGMEKGFSEEAMTLLWDTIKEFAKYGFNKSHSVGYAMVSYKSAYLKAHYPVEFVSALLTQKLDKKDDILEILQEARKMGLKIGTVDINLSQAEVTPDFSHSTNFDILYGMAGVSAVSMDMANLIVKEREENGLFESVEDAITRCFNAGVTNKKIFENLAFAGAFDGFGVSRRSVVENIQKIIAGAKTKANKGEDLFDIFADDNDKIKEIDLTQIVEYPFVDKLAYESETIGLYLTGHPMDNLGGGLRSAGIKTISEILSAKKKGTYQIAAVVSSITRKSKKNGKSINVTLDDGKSYLNAYVNKNVVQAIDKKSDMARLEKIYQDGKTSVPDDIMKNISLDVEPMDDIQKGGLYILDVSYFPAWNEGDADRVAISGIRPLKLSDKGVMPLRVRVKINTTEPADSDDYKKLVKEKIQEIEKFSRVISRNIDKKMKPSDIATYAISPVMVGVFSSSSFVVPDNKAWIEYYENLVKEIKGKAKELENSEIVSEKDDDNRKNSINSDKKYIADNDTNGNFDKASDSKDDFFSQPATKPNKKPATTLTERDLPVMDLDIVSTREMSDSELAEKMEYIEIPVHLPKIGSLKKLFGDKYGSDRFDFGIFINSEKKEK